MSSKHREEKLKYALFAIELNRAIVRKCINVKVKSFLGLPKILKKLTTLGFIKGFENLNNGYLQIFFKFGSKSGTASLKKIKLLTKTSIKNYQNLFELKRLAFHNKSFLTRLFILSTREGLTLIDNPGSTKIAGELIYQIN